MDDFPFTDFVNDALHVPLEAKLIDLEKLQHIENEDLPMRLVS